MKVKKLPINRRKIKYLNPWLKNVYNDLSKIYLLNISSVNTIPTNHYDVSQTPGLFNNYEVEKR